MRGVEKRWGRRTLRRIPLPQKRFWNPASSGTFPVSQVLLLCFSCTEVEDSAHQKLLSRGPKFFWNVRCLVLFPPPVRFAPPPCSGSEKRVFWKRGLFRKVNFPEILESLENSEILENPQTVENKGESDHFPEILENLENFEILDQLS